MFDHDDSGNNNSDNYEMIITMVMKLVMMVTKLVKIITIVKKRS